MKKVLAIVFALIFALSAATSAFAMATTCPYCGDEIVSEKAYNEHVFGKCPVKYPASSKTYKECPYGCGAKYEDNEQYEIHIANCSMKKETTEDKIANFIKNIDFKAIGEKLMGVLAKIDFPALANKVIGLLEKAVVAIIGAVK